MRVSACDSHRYRNSSRAGRWAGAGAWARGLVFRARSGCSDADGEMQVLRGRRSHCRSPAWLREEDGLAGAGLGRRTSCFALGPRRDGALGCGAWCPTPLKGAGGVRVAELGAVDAFQSRSLLAMKSLAGGSRSTEQPLSRAFSVAWALNSTVDPPRPCRVEQAGAVRMGHGQVCNGPGISVGLTGRDLAAGGVRRACGLGDDGARRLMAADRRVWKVRQTWWSRSGRRTTAYRPVGAPPLGGAAPCAERKVLPRPPERAEIQR